MFERSASSYGSHVWHRPCVQVGLSHLRFGWLESLALISCIICCYACSDTANYRDEQDNPCAAWVGYDCFAAEAWGYSEQGKDELLWNCQASCESCAAPTIAPTPYPPTPEPTQAPTTTPTMAPSLSPTAAPPPTEPPLCERRYCADDSEFRDEYGQFCAAWAGYSCSNAASVYGYTQEGEDALKANCRLSCDLCDSPTSAPTPCPPTLAPTGVPPTNAPSAAPTLEPSHAPTNFPTPMPTLAPSVAPTITPTPLPPGITVAPTAVATVEPTPFPTLTPPTYAPTAEPTPSPPSPMPTQLPTTDSPTPPPTAPPPCVDIPGYRDEQGAPCKAWVGYSCADAFVWGYTEEGMEDLRQNCRVSCSLCTPNPSAAPTMGPTPAPSPAPTPLPPGETFSPTYAPTPPTPSPTHAPTYGPTARPTVAPTMTPTFAPTLSPSVSPTLSPTSVPTPLPTLTPTLPTLAPTFAPSDAPTPEPTASPTQPTPAPTSPTVSPSFAPTAAPTMAPTPPTASPTSSPTATPTVASMSPTATPTMSPTVLTPAPTTAPVTPAPTSTPTQAQAMPTYTPIRSPAPTPAMPTAAPTQSPTAPTLSPTIAPTPTPTEPTAAPTSSPTAPTQSPTFAPTLTPTFPTPGPTLSPTAPTLAPTPSPTFAPTAPTASPTSSPTLPTNSPTLAPPTNSPTRTPPTSAPTPLPPTEAFVPTPPTASTTPTPTLSLAPSTPPGMLLLVPSSAPTPTNETNDVLELNVSTISVDVWSTNESDAEVEDDLTNGTDSMSLSVESSIGNATEDDAEAPSWNTTSPSPFSSPAPTPTQTAPTMAPTSAPTSAPPSQAPTPLSPSASTTLTTTAFNTTEPAVQTETTTAASTVLPSTSGTSTELSASTTRATGLGSTSGAPTADDDNETSVGGNGTDTTTTTTEFARDVMPPGVDECVRLANLSVELDSCILMASGGHRCRPRCTVGMLPVGYLYCKEHVVGASPEVFGSPSCVQDAADIQTIEQEVLWFTATFWYQQLGQIDASVSMFHEAVAAALHLSPASVRNVSVVTHSARAFRRLQGRALQNGIPYQTLDVGIEIVVPENFTARALNDNVAKLLTSGSPEQLAMYTAIEDTYSIRMVWIKVLEPPRTRMETVIFRLTTPTSTTAPMTSGDEADSTLIAAAAVSSCIVALCLASGLACLLYRRRRRMAAEKQQDDVPFKERVDEDDHQYEAEESGHGEPAGLNTRTQQKRRGDVGMGGMQPMTPRRTPSVLVRDPVMRRATTPQQLTPRARSPYSQDPSTWELPGTEPHPVQDSCMRKSLKVARFLAKKAPSWRGRPPDQVPLNVLFRHSSYFGGTDVKGKDGFLDDGVFSFASTNSDEEDDADSHDHTVLDIWEASGTDTWSYAWSVPLDAHLGVESLHDPSNVSLPLRRSDADLYMSSCNKAPSETTRSTVSTSVPAIDHGLQAPRWNATEGAAFDSAVFIDPMPPLDFAPVPFLGTPDRFRSRECSSFDSTFTEQVLPPGYSATEPVLPPEEYSAAASGLAEPERHRNVTPATSPSGQILRGDWDVSYDNVYVCTRHVL